MRWSSEGGELAKSGADAPGLAGVDACRSLFTFWRNSLMGNRDARTLLDPAVAGYFFDEPPSPGAQPEPIPLGQVRRRLRALVDDTRLTDEQRSAIHLYYGLHGLPLPFSSSRSEPDLAAGRDESCPRGTVRAALAELAKTIPARPRAQASARRPPTDPLLTRSFRDLPLNTAGRRRLVARAYIRACAGCDGPHAAPTLDGLARWYRHCGLADPDLLEARTDDRARPNRNALARAAALMEVALFEEIERLPLGSTGAGEPTGGEARLEVVTHPDLVALLDGDPSPAGLVDAATVLKHRALAGRPVDGPLALLLRCVRPQIAILPEPELERLAAAISYVAVVDGNPFLALEWFRHLTDHVGVTDRTFTLLVNCSEAASEGGYHGLATRVDGLWARSLADWDIPDHQIPLVEHTEAEQQRLIASAYRLERLGDHHGRVGDHGRAVTSLRRSVQLAARSATMAERVLTDTSAFPTAELPDKAGHHGGDLTWPWMLGALVRIVEPLTKLDSLARERLGGDRELAALVGRTAQLTRAALQRYQGDFEQDYYHTWYERIDRQTTLLSSI